MPKRIVESNQLPRRDCCAANRKGALQAMQRKEVDTWVAVLQSCYPNDQVEAWWRVPVEPGAVRFNDCILRTPAECRAVMQGTRLKPPKKVDH